MTYKSELNVAIETAQKAGTIQLKHQRRILDIKLKLDHSPVTEVDIECEKFIRNELLSAFPDDGFIGEETGDVTGKSGRTWMVDPLDGTRPYIRGIPTYSVLIGLEDNGEYTVGVTHFPAKEETYWASKGDGAFCNKKKIHVSSTKEMSEAIGSSLGIIEKMDSEEGKKLLTLLRRWDYVYGFMDAYSYMCVASGKLDICMGLIDAPLDRVTAACIVTEAGGCYSDLYGNKSIHKSSFVLSNGILHDQIIKHFK